MRMLEPLRAASTMCASVHATSCRFDLWDSEENFDAFSRTLLPILEELGINSGEPDVFDVHNIMR